MEIQKQPARFRLYGYNPYQENAKELEKFLLDNFDTTDQSKVIFYRKRLAECIYDEWVDVMLYEEAPDFADEGYEEIDGLEVCTIPTAVIHVDEDTTEEDEYEIYKEVIDVMQGEWFCHEGIVGKDKHEEIRELAERMGGLQVEKSKCEQRLEDEKYGCVEKVELLEGEMKDSKSKIEELESKMKDIESKIETLQKQKDANEEMIDMLYENLNESTKALNKLEDEFEDLDYKHFVAASDLKDVLFIEDIEIPDLERYIAWCEEEIEGLKNEIIKVIPNSIFASKEKHQKPLTL